MDTEIKTGPEPIANFPSPKLQIVVGGEPVIGTSRPRARVFSLGEKRRMVAESYEPGAVVSEVARRNGVRPDVLFEWRRKFRDSEATSQRVKKATHQSKASEAPFAPVLVRHAMPAAGLDDAALVVEMPGMVVRVGHNAPAEFITIVLDRLSAGTRG